MARSKTIDKITPESEMFFVTWYRALVNIQSVDAWARLALIALAIAIVLALAYLFAERIWLRKVGFFGAFALLVVFVVSNLFAWQQKKAIDHPTGACHYQLCRQYQEHPLQEWNRPFHPS